MPVRIAARYLLPIDAPPIERGVIEIDDAGAILAVRPHAVGEEVTDLGEVAILPAMINAHTHLEFSLLEAPLGQPRMVFGNWIAEVVAHRRARGASGVDLAAEKESALEVGLRDSAAYGVAAVGEIATHPFPFAPFASRATESPRVDAHLFLELLGLSADRVAPLLELAEAHLQQGAGQALRGLSPHAPYTVHPDLLTGAIGLSKKYEATLAMHLAESWDELELLTSHSGPMVDTLRSLGAWNPSAIPRGVTFQSYLEQLAQAHRALVIHGNLLTTSDYAILAQHKQMWVVYCPRTQSYFPHGNYPLAEMLSSGVQVTVGTDSRASTPSLSVWEELQHIAAMHENVPASTILRLGTIEAARALGLDSKLGSITSGKLAKFVAVPISETPHDHEDLYELALQQQPTIVGSW
ncbi:amidohydrolase [Pirellula staleyi DSM 6068]|uniref:Amidohydrolase n=1 Tax=Pirellula staleyi (strain ATCC 27377 / DSM 6068 / ICPB 4128) TaxID=530564 RepID=D2R811_PIRSD|nr:amidohydrolase family protein [Pirellula staleyi]ADB19342.1 amidohydrolase [Pirellula staleyi DSM 6068]